MRALLVALALSAYASTVAVGSEVQCPAQGTTSYVGVYRENFEIQIFQPNGADTEWWAIYSTKVRDALRAAAPEELGPDRAFALNVELEGAVSEGGGPGMFDAYQCRIRITRLISATPVDSRL